MSFTIISKPTAINKVYRYFHEETHADAFMKGQVRVSTLNICRRYENPMQGDKDEACLLYYSQSTMGRGNDPKMQEVAKRLNMDIKLGANSWVAMIGTSSRSEQEDAFIYCTSTQFDPSKFKSDFGEYCVQIIDTGYFLKKISEAIHCINPLINSCAGKVNYKDRLL